MSVIDLAKAHLQNVNAKIEELKNQRNLIDDEIQRLSLYIAKGLEEIENSEKVATSEQGE